MSIIEELWYGNIYPSEHPIKNNSEYMAALRKVLAEKESLSAKLPPEYGKALEQLLDAQSNVDIIAERDAFILGFRLAAQLMADALGSPLYMRS